jgi:hypothetical protein
MIKAYYMKLLSLLILSSAVAFLTSCSGCPWTYGSGCCGNEDIPTAPYKELPAPQLSIHSGEIIAIVQDYAVELQKQRHLYLRHSNTYYNEDGIYAIQLRFISQDIIELCEARKLIIDVSEGMLEQLNANPELVSDAKYHAFYPFNLEVYIDFESYFIRYIDPFYVKWITMEDGQITFYTADVKDTDKKGWHAKKESYSTSRDIVFYQRLAEDKYRATHAPDRTIFGEKRFYLPEAP